MNNWIIWVGIVGLALFVINLLMLILNHFTQCRVYWVFAWYDFWIGFYWDQKNRVLYFFPIPMLGLKLILPAIDYDPPPQTPA